MVRGRGEVSTGYAWVVGCRVVGGRVAGGRDGEGRVGGGAVGGVVGGYNVVGLSSSWVSDSETDVEMSLTFDPPLEGFLRRESGDKGVRNDDFRLPFTTFECSRLLKVVARSSGITADTLKTLLTPV